MPLRAHSDACGPASWESSDVTAREIFDTTCLASAATDDEGQLRDPAREKELAEMLSRIDELPDDKLVELGKSRLGNGSGGEVENSETIREKLKASAQATFWELPTVEHLAFGPVLSSMDSMAYASNHAERPRYTVTKHSCAMLTTSCVCRYLNAFQNFRLFRTLFDPPVSGKTADLKAHDEMITGTTGVPGNVHGLASVEVGMEEDDQPRLPHNDDGVAQFLERDIANVRPNVTFTDLHHSRSSTLHSCLRPRCPPADYRSRVSLCVTSSGRLKLQVLLYTSLGDEGRCTIRVY